MPNINIDDAYVLDETGAQVDKVTGLFTKDEDTTSGEKAFAQLNIGTAGSNRNLLDNPWFTNPVNQRGLTTYSGSGQLKTIDRWFLFNGSGANSLTVQNGYLSVKSDGNGFAQATEPAMGTALNGKTLTCSVLFKDGTIKSATGVYNSAALVSIGNGFYLGLNGGKQTIFNYLTGNGVTQDIVACKTELGSVSTLANDAPPDYWQELDKCLYYFERITNNGSSPLTIGAGFADGVNNLYTPVRMHRKRAGIATVSYSGTIYAGQRSSNIVVSSVTQYNSSPDGIITLLAVTPSSFTNNEYYRLALGAGAHIDFSADL